MDILDTVITEPLYDAAVKYLNSFDKKRIKKRTVTKTNLQISGFGACKFTYICIAY